MHKMKVFFIKAKTRNEKKKHFFKKIYFCFSSRIYFNDLFLYPFKFC